LTHASGNFFKKLAQVVLTLHMCRSIFYQFFSCTSFWHAIAHSCIPGQKLSGTTRAVQHDWPNSCCCFLVISFRFFPDIFI